MRTGAYFLNLACIPNEEQEADMNYDPRNPEHRNTDRRDADRRDPRYGAQYGENPNGENGRRTPSEGAVGAIRYVGRDTARGTRI